MPPPPAGHVRVFARANVGPLYAQRWSDVPADHPSLPGWRAQGFVADVDRDGNGPPAHLPQRCCGAR
jgi:hypothetical protein